MARKQNYDYFGVFVKVADYICQAAAMVDETMRDFSREGLPERMEKVHAIEHKADVQKHEMVKALAREFLPPIEVEDVAEAAQLLDDVVDLVEDVMIKLYTFNIDSIRADALIFSDIIVKCSGALKDAVVQFGSFKKNKGMVDSIVEINRWEGEGDALYTKAMHELHATSKDPVEILVWSRMFDCLERCCDAMEHVADFIENTVMKNS